MKKLHKQLLLLTFISCSSLLLSAQPYQNAVGIRGGWYNGITFRHSISESKYLEGIFTSRWRGFNLTGLYEIQKPLKEDGFDWYYGAGLHIGSFNRYYYYDHGNPHYLDQGHVLTLGLDGIIGLEYTFSEIPLNLSLDIHPLIELADGGFWPWYDAALSARFKIN